MDTPALEAAQPVVYRSDAARIAALRGVILDEGPSTDGQQTVEEEPYYWDNGGDPNPPVDKVVRHNLHWIAFGTLHAMEVVGEFFNQTFGMNNSRYQWALDLARRQEEEAEEREMAEERQRRWAELHRLQAEEDRAAREGSGAAAPVVQPECEGHGLAGQEEGQGAEEEDGEEGAGIV